MKDYHTEKQSAPLPCGGAGGGASFFPESELIINPDGSIFHLHLRPEQLADKVILVGDPGVWPLWPRTSTGWNAKWRAASSRP